MRINRFLALCKVASRRKAEELIVAGKVRINGRVAVLTDEVSDSDRVEFAGKILTPPAEYDYFLLNKPAGVLSSVGDDRGRKSVVDFLPKGCKAAPVGRLDLDTTGVLLLTNDGELLYRLTHPSFGIRKIYRAGVTGDFTQELADQIKKGVTVDGVEMKAEAIAINTRRNRYCEITITLVEGRKREVKEMIKAVGCRVVSLTRISFANITCSGLETGAIRRLTDPEVAALYRLTKLSEK